jgi:hypothetical protein
MQGNAGGAQFSPWNKGQYGSAETTGTPNNAEDDIAIISNTNAHGLPLIDNEAGDTESSATALCTAIGSCTTSPTTAGYVRATADAVLNSENDRDFFSFTASADGSVTIRIDYTPLWSQEEVFDTGSQGMFTYVSSFQRSNLHLDLGFAAGTPVQGLVKPQPNVFDASNTFTAMLPAAGERFCRPLSCNYARLAFSLMGLCILWLVGV